MGAGQSSQDASSTTIKTSYYVLLGVDKEATEDEIKRAYRRKALELHPDRNYGKEDEATRLFSDVQAAYEVLSDPQERAWYDSHEGAILRGYEDGDDGTKDGAYSYGDIKITTTEDVSRFVANLAMKRVDYDNVPDKFFTELNEFFAKLAEEESRASRMEGLDDPELPSFGHKNDSYDDVVKAFYVGWNSFSTNKSYFWADKWNLTEAPDRRYRRAMEKENKKERDDAIREFNDSVRTLVSFVRKRDPRYSPNFQSDADRQSALREAAQAQAARSRKANAEMMAAAADAVPEWARAKPPEDDEGDFDSEEEVIEEIECVACHKSFRSEKQFQAHEKSKKHQKAVQALKRQMQKDNAILEFRDGDTDNHSEQAANGAVDDGMAASCGSSIASFDDLEQMVDEVHDVQLSDSDSARASSTASIVQADSQDSAHGLEADSPTSTATESLQDVKQASIAEHDPAGPKMGKAAQKRAKKAAKGASTDVDTQFTCAHCKASFATRTRLFQHIKDFGHAAPQSTVQAGKKKKGKR